MLSRVTLDRRAPEQRLQRGLLFTDINSCMVGAVLAFELHTQLIKGVGKNLCNESGVYPSGADAARAHLLARVVGALVPGRGGAYGRFKHTAFIGLGRKDSD